MGPTMDFKTESNFVTESKFVMMATGIGEI